MRHRRAGISDVHASNVSINRQRFRGLAGAVAALALFTSCSASTGPMPAAPARASCATANAAFLPTPEAFVSEVDGRFVESPLLGHRLGGGPYPAAISDWRAGRGRGWINQVAIDGPDRAAENSIARALGYTVGTLPLVPLIGPVVEHNPGALEIYQTNTEYNSAAGAIDLMSDLAGSARLAETTIVTESGHVQPPAHAVPFTWGDESLAYEQPGFMGPQGATETFFTFAVRVGRFVVQFSVQSGYGLTEPEAATLLGQAVAPLTRSCGLAPLPRIEVNR
jgi:hypothetical protein